MAERPTPLLLDANLCVLLAVGTTRPSYIAKHKRLAAYDVQDFHIVDRIVARAQRILLCPNVLTEASNLARQAPEPIRREVSLMLTAIAARSIERYVESSVAMTDARYPALGLTDAVLLTLARDGGALLTADLDLYLAAVRAGHDATNYNHIREQRRDYR
jgi:predicted nucleic acid-binding protein